MSAKYSADEERQTATLSYEISTMWETMPISTTSKDFCTVNGTGTGHEAQNRASYMMMMILMMIMMNISPYDFNHAFEFLSLIFYIGNFIGAVSYTV